MAVTPFDFGEVLSEIFGSNLTSVTLEFDWAHGVPVMAHVTRYIELEEVSAILSLMKDSDGKSVWKEIVERREEGDDGSND